MTRHDLSKPNSVVKGLTTTERAPVSAGSPAAAVRDERIVDEIAARWLITTAALADGLRWTPHPGELVEHLKVDELTLHTRMTTLDTIEVAELEHELNGESLSIP